VVEGFSADGTATLADGTRGQLLQVVTATGKLEFLAPAPDVSELLADVARYSAAWHRSRRVDTGVAGRTRAALAEGAAAAGGVAVQVRQLGAPLQRGALVAVAAPTALARFVAGAVHTLAWWLDAAAASLKPGMGRATRAAGASVVGLAAVAAGRGARRGAATAGSWCVAAGRCVVIPLAALMRPVGRGVASASAPARRRLGTTVVGLAVLGALHGVADGGRELSSRAGRWRADHGPIALLAGLSSLLLVSATLLALLTSGPASEAAAHGQAKGPLSPLALSDASSKGIDTSSMARMVALLQGGTPKSLDLPPATAPPTPAPPSLADAPALRPHEIFGFAPYWTLPQSGGFDVNGMTTLAYFSVDANANGSLDQSDAGWNGYESQALADLVSRAHAAGDRVVLTVTCFDQGSLDAITSDPSAPARLSAALIQAVEAKNLDGVNIDFEGEGSADQQGLTNLVTQVSAAFKTADPHYQVTMDTYASSAGDPSGFYNIKALAPAVDGFFVMAYQLNLKATASSASPLTSTMFSDLTTVEQYSAAVDPAKIILGVPFYGYEWPTTDGTLTAQATGGANPITYGQVMASGHPIYWDPVTQTAWTSYDQAGQWYEDFFEDPSSLYLEAQLAQFFHLEGLGIWALGFEGRSNALQDALLGFAPALKTGLAGPTSTSHSVGPPTTGSPSFQAVIPKSQATGGAAPAGPRHHARQSGNDGGRGGPPVPTTVGTWDGRTVHLEPTTAPPPPAALDVGTLAGFTTTDPAWQCLENGPGLPVVQVAPGETAYDVVATVPTDCVSATFTFDGPRHPKGGGPVPTTTTTTTGPASSTTSTGP